MNRSVKRAQNFKKMGNGSLGWKIFGLFISIGLIAGGLSGEFVLRGTNSNEALVVFGCLFLIWDIISIATHKKKQPIVNEQFAAIGIEEHPEELHPETETFTLEHSVGSRYHHVGECQKITSDRVEIGRDPSCEVRFDDNFETVSRRHAAIIRDGSHWKLAALSQTNPSFINGKIVQREWYLQNGDEIQCAVNGPTFVFRAGTNSL